MGRIIGFCNGVTHKILEVISKRNIDLLKNCGSNAIEVNCHYASEADNLNNFLPWIKDFDYVSLHLPGDVRYDDNLETKILLGKIEKFYIKTNAKLAVVHPDLVDDWSVFEKYSLDWAIENMDDRKKRFKNEPDLREFFEDHPSWNLVLDLGHVNSNDKTMKLADDLITSFRTRIKEIHLSGYKIFHDPLYLVEQVDIINYCNSLDVPIIIESVLEKEDGEKGVKKEYDYILKNLK